MDSSSDLSSVGGPPIRPAGIRAAESTPSLPPGPPPGIERSPAYTPSNPTALRQQLTPTAQGRAAEKSKGWFSQNWKKVLGWTFVGIGALCLVLGIATLPFFGGGTAGIVLGVVFLAAGAGLLAWDRVEKKKSKVPDALQPPAIQQQVRSQGVRDRASRIHSRTARDCGDLPNPSR